MKFFKSRKHKGEVRNEYPKPPDLLDLRIKHYLWVLKVKKLPEDNKIRRNILVRSISEVLQIWDNVPFDDKVQCEILILKSIPQSTEYYFSIPASKRTVTENGELSPEESVLSEFSTMSKYLTKVLEKAVEIRKNEILINRKVTEEKFNES